MKLIINGNDRLSPEQIASRARQARRREIEESMRGRGATPDTIASLAERIERIENILDIGIDPEE